MAGETQQASYSVWYKITYNFEVFREPGNRQQALAYGSYDDLAPYLKLRTYNQTHQAAFSATKIQSTLYVSSPDGFAASNFGMSHHQIYYANGGYSGPDSYYDGHYHIWDDYVDYAMVTARISDIYYNGDPPSSGPVPTISNTLRSTLDNGPGRSPIVDYNTVTRVAYQWVRGTVTDKVDLDGNGFDDRGDNDYCPGKKGAEDRVASLGDEISDISAKLAASQALLQKHQAEAARQKQGAETLTTLSDRILEVELAKAATEAVVGVTPWGRLATALVAAHDVYQFWTSKGDPVGDAAYISHTVEEVIKGNFSVNSTLHSVASGLGPAVGHSLEVLGAALAYREYQTRQVEIDRVLQAMARAEAEAAADQASSNGFKDHLAALQDELKRAVDCRTWLDMAGSSAGSTASETAEFALTGVDTPASSTIEVVPGIALIQARTAVNGQLLTGTGITRVLALLSGANDVVEIGSSQNILLDGGAGNDTVRFTGRVSEIAWTFAANGAIYLRFANGTDVILNGVETLVAADGIFRADLGPMGAWEMTGSGATDTLTGTAAGDFLNGGAATDQLRGGDGNDTLDGGRDGDVMYGGNGDDRYFVDHVGDAVIEGSDQGLDTVVASISYTLPGQIEILELSGTALIAGTGNAQANVLRGNDAANMLDGLAGDDLIEGNGGNDAVFGREGQDWIKGGVGNDTASGGDGNDSVWGEADDDLLDGGAGDDTIFGGAGNDTVTYVNATSRVEINLSMLEDQNTRGAGVDTLVSIENVAGSAFDDSLTGNAAANRLTGGRGADVLTGGGGADIFSYAAVSDSAVGAADRITDFERGDRIDLSLIDAKTGTAGDDWFTFVGISAFSRTAGELRATGSGSDWLVEGDVNGDGVADFAILVTTAAVPLGVADFVL